MDLNNTDEQMQAITGEQEVDPVSGNEIPPGSLPEEVRDDVDAKLSEGEYVVPADVVRFFGVDYFEKLRKKAKEGLAQMDADGRIGGEPLPAQGSEDDFPFSDEELMTMGDDEPIGMAEGGLVEQFKKELSSQRDIADWRDQKEGFLSAEEHSKRLGTPQSKTYTPVKEGIERPFLKRGDPVIDEYYSNSPTMQSYVDGEPRGNDLDKEALSGLPYLQQLTLELEELSNREMSGNISEREQKLLDSYREFFTPRVGMAEGGSVKSTFNPANYAAGFSSNTAGGSSSVTGVENKTYMNKDGEQRVIMFVNGQPIQQIPAGFVEATPENKAELTKQQVSGNIPAGEVVTEFGGGLGADGTDAGFAQEGPDIGSMDAAALADFAQGEFGAMQGLANAAGMLGLGPVAMGAVSMTGKAIANRADELGVPNPLGKEGKKGLIGKAIDAVTGKGAPSEAAMAAAAPAGMTYSGETGGYSRSGSAAPTSSPNPPSMSAAMAAQTGRSSPAPSVSSSGSTGGRGGGGGSSGGSGPSGDSGEAGYGGGYGGYAARGMLVDKRVRQKQKPKPEGKGLVKRKPKSK